MLSASGSSVVVAVQVATVLVSDTSDGDWPRRWRLSPSVGSATVALAAGVGMACGNEEEKDAIVRGRSFSFRVF